MHCSSKLHSILLGMALALATTLCAQETLSQPGTPQPSFYASLNTAYDAASTNRSLVLVVFSAQWCGPCQVMKQTALESDTFLTRAGALAMVDVDIDVDTKTARIFNVTAVPTLVLLTADKKIVARQTGALDAAGLLSWIENARQRAARGQWEGAAPGSKVDALIAKASSEGLDAGDLQQLLAMLDQPDPADRLAASKLILAQRELAMAPLIDALTNTYLGVRIEAATMLHHLAPDSPAIDPWQAPSELAQTASDLKKWWTQTGKLPPPDPARALDGSVKSSIDAAVQSLRSDDPVKRTEAMSTLVAHGESALPALREAIKRAERNGDHRIVSVIEDVRWAILIPDTLERQFPVRNTLARGSSPERLAAAAKLGRLGKNALAPLLELANDADPLVVESAVRALSAFPGKDAIPAMAALLKAADSNLRMTAAQALGHTKNPDANTPLIGVVDDPNEVVACAAVAALEEINGGENYSARKQPAEVVAALKRALVDSRWRVRAATAEVVGKLQIRALSTDLKTALNDSDGFVVKAALGALKTLSAPPKPSELQALIRRLPSLRGDVLEMLIEDESTTTVKSVTEIYDASGPEDKLAVLRALLRRARNTTDSTNTVWKPLLARATTTPDTRLRSQAAELLQASPPLLTAELAGPLLNDEDLPTRIAAAQAVLSVLSKTPEDLAVERLGGHSSRPVKSAPPLVSAERLASWHSALKQRPGFETNATLAAALYVTGNPKTNLSILLAALQRVDDKTVAQLHAASAIRAILSKLPWPEGKPVIEKFCATPVFFCLAVADSDRAAPAIADYLLDASRFKAAVEPASSQDLQRCLPLLLGGAPTSGQRPKWSLLNQYEQEIVSALAGSTNAGWRTAAVYASSQRTDAQSKRIVDKALSDPNPWVCSAAANGFAHQNTNRALLEQRLGQLLSNPRRPVALAAANALLPSETLQAAGLEWDFRRFQYEEIQVTPSTYSSSLTDEQPLSVLETKPAFLEEVRSRLPQADERDSQIFALLLAQYGQFDGLDQLIKNPNLKKEEANQVVLAAIGLSRDPKYIPYLQAVTQNLKTEWELRKILRACKGMSGPEVRQLRLDVNRLIRKASESNL